jgi:hypothetical protein
MFRKQFSASAGSMWQRKLLATSVSRPKIDSTTKSEVCLV